MSAYADDPQAAAESLVPLLEEAERAVPKALRPETPVRVGVSELIFVFLNCIIK